VEPNRVVATLVSSGTNGVYHRGTKGTENCITVRDSPEAGFRFCEASVVFETALASLG